MIFWGRKLSQICGYLQKFSQQNLGLWHSLAQHIWEICESFSMKIVFFTNLWKFSPLKVSNYTVHHSGKSSSFPSTLTPRYNGGSLSDRGSEGEVRAGETVDTGSSSWRPVPVHAKDTGRTADTMMALFSLTPCCPLNSSLLATSFVNQEFICYPYLFVMVNNTCITAH